MDMKMDTEDEVLYLRPWTLTYIVLNCWMSRWMARDTVWTKSQSPQSLRPPVYSSSSPL